MGISIKENGFEMSLNAPTIIIPENLGKVMASFYELATTAKTTSIVEPKIETPALNKTKPKVEKAVDEKAKHFSDLAKMYHDNSVAKPVFEEKNNSNSNDSVKTLIDCPVCNAHYKTNLNKYFKGIRCRQCGSNLFLGWATGVRGELDEDGNYFIANSEFVSKQKIEERNEFESMFTADGSYPNAENTIAEITKYLDDNKIDHKGVTLKGKLLELAKNK